MIAEIIGVGSRLMQQGELEQCAGLIAQELTQCGITVEGVCPVDASAQLLQAEIAKSLERNDLLIILGGLIPGKEEITKAAVCDGLGRRPVLHEDSLRRIQAAYEQRGQQMPQKAARLAMLPEQSVVFPGVRGVTPGCAISAGEQFIMMLPDDPREFLPMFKNSVVPYLAKFSAAAVVTKTLGMFGITEQSLGVKLGAILNSRNPSVELVPRRGEFQLRITARAGSKTEAAAIIAPVAAEILRRLGDAVYGEDEGSLSEVTVEELREARLSVSAGESGTDGILSQLLGGISGEPVLDYDVSVGSDRLKQDALKVPVKLLKKYGGTSAQVAAAMAIGAMEEGRSPLGAAVTVSGGRNDDSKRGSVAYAAVCDGTSVWVRDCKAPKGTSRDMLRLLSSLECINMIRLYTENKLLGGTPLKVALAGKLEDSDTTKGAGDSMPREHDEDYNEERGFFAKVLPWKGDSVGDVIRKIIFILAACIFIGSAAYIITFYGSAVGNRKQNDTLAAEYSAALGIEDGGKIVVPGNYPKGYQTKFANLFGINEDVAGWLTIPDTQVNYPIVQYSDNDYYLHRDFYGKENKHGIPWLEANNKMEPQSDNYVIYGHNMTDGQMFGEIMRYKGEKGVKDATGIDFLRAHPIISFDDLYRDNDYKIISVFITNAKPKYGPMFYYNECLDLSDPAKFNEFVSEVQARSYYTSDIDVKQGDQFITLSSCSYEFGPVSIDADVRTVVVGRRIRPGEKADGKDIIYAENNNVKLPEGFLNGGKAVASQTTSSSAPASAPASSVPQSSAVTPPANAAASSSAPQTPPASSSAPQTPPASSSAPQKVTPPSSTAPPVASSSSQHEAIPPEPLPPDDADAPFEKEVPEELPEDDGEIVVLPPVADDFEEGGIEQESARLSDRIIASMLPAAIPNSIGSASGTFASEMPEIAAYSSRTKKKKKTTDKLTVMAGGKKVSGKSADIVAQVVMNETSGALHQEALKAQAVAAYTYIKFENAAGRTPYVALKKPNAAAKKAVAAVAGEAVYYKNKLAFTPYYATSAGVTVSSADVWGGSYPYLVSVDSSIDEDARNYEVSVELYADEVADKVDSALGFDLYDYSDPEDWFEIESYTKGGKYVKRVRVGDETISGRALREQVLGLRSAAFDIDYDDDEELFTFTTYGYGHGVGLSQTGADLYAREEGWSYEEILEHYYKGTTVK